MKMDLPCTPIAQNARVGIGEKLALCVIPATTMECVVMEPREMAVVIVRKDLMGKNDVPTV